MIEPRVSRPLDDEGRIFDEDDTDLTESQEFDKALALGAEALQRGEPESAKGMLEKALRYKPRNQRARNLLGLSLFKLGELDKAESLYRGLIDDHPSDPTLRVNLGLVFLKSGAAADAVRCFETAIDLQPEHAKSQNYLGLAYSQQGDHLRAREWFLKSGNAQMAERMAQLLANSPIRQVAHDAEKLVEAERPFKSALADKTDEHEAVQDSREDQEEPSPPESAPPSSRWVATPPASLAPPAVIEEKLQRMPLGRLALSRKAPDGLDESHEQDAPEEQGSADESVSAEPVREEIAIQPVAGPMLLLSYSSTRPLEAPRGDGAFLVGKTDVLVQVRTELLTRLDGLVAAFGAPTLKPELKRFRGKATDKSFGEGARRMLRVTGSGRYFIAKAGRRFTALELGDEPAYFREEALFAFEEALVFENGRVPSKSGSDLHLVHLRGRGHLLLVTVGEPRAVEVRKGDPLRIPMEQLVGWHGPLLQPRLVPLVEDAPEMGIALELAGEGRALIDAPEDE